MNERADGRRYLPAGGRPQTISMGLRRLALEDWLEPDGRRAADLAAKAVLLRERHADVVAVTPQGDAGSAETLELVVADLRRRGLVGADEAPDPDLHPVDVAGRLVQEDLCVMVRDESGWVLAAASVCSPSRWRLADKIGRGLAEIHEPVPHYDRIERATDRFFDTVAVDRPVWRTNWTLLDDPAAFQPEAPRPDAPLGERIHLRVERQTVRRLPRTGAVLFTIRTYVDPVGSLPERARADLAATLDDIDPAVAAYRGWGRLLPAVRADLARP